MMNRRSFLKLTGLSAAAVGTGYGAGRILETGNGGAMSLHGFLPDDGALLSDLLTGFVRSLPADVRMAHVSVTGDPAVARHAEAVLRGLRAGTATAGSARLQVRISRLARPVPGDILAGDRRAAILHPDRDFTASYARLRSKVLGSDAVLMISAEYQETGPVTGLFERHEVVVENERGVYDRFALGSDRRVDIPGPHGSTGLTIRSGAVHVHSSSCRHALCQRVAPATRQGDVIACAPNRVLIRIERA